MKFNSLAVIAAAAGLFTVAAQAASQLPIPVTVSGTVTAACSTATTGLAFAFGNVPSGSSSAASEQVADLVLNCSTGTSYSFSTAAASAASSYVVSTGSSTTADSFPTGCVKNNPPPAPPSLNVQQHTPDADNPSPVTCNTTTGSSTPLGKVFLAVLDNAVYSDLATAIVADGTDQTTTLAARLQESSSTTFDDSAKVPSTTGAFTATGAQLYINY